MDESQSVYLLWHGDDFDHGPDPKLLGVYSSEQAAQSRVDRSRSLPGFCDHPDAFVISRYTIDKDEWIEGYREV